MLTGSLEILALVAVALAVGLALIAVVVVVVVDGDVIVGWAFDLAFGVIIITPRN
jgi:hypothetical protein